MELNKILLIGNLTRDPESRFLQSGSQVCQLRLACNRRAGKDKEEVLYIDVEAWNKTAELCSQYLQKGSQILVEGRLKMDQFTNQQGENRTKYLIVADRVQFGARPEGSAGGGGERRQPSQRPAQAVQQERASYADPAYDGGSSETEDDLPF
ncbi:MAG: single-strand DNA-binding protein [Candidatus Sumerlaeota bacterium]|nr:single-strand DNA-binding protein [Candidatus Sumerlaeota bacterium]